MLSNPVPSLVALWTDVWLRSKLRSICNGATLATGRELHMPNLASAAGQCRVLAGLDLKHADDFNAAGQKGGSAE